MAQIDRPYVSMTLRDGIGRDSVVQFYTTLSLVQQYVAAANQAARDATAIGVLFAKLLGLTQMTEVSQAACLAVVQDPVADIADDILRGNKLQFFINGGGRSYTFTVPGRDPAAYSQQSNSLQVALDSPAAMDDFVTQVAAVVKSISGNAVVVTSAQVVD